jgi:hypothetical protein
MQTDNKKQCNFYLPKLHSALADFWSKYNRPIRCSVTNIYPQVLSIGQKLTFNAYIVGATGPAGEPGKEGPQGPTGNYWTLLNVYLFLALGWQMFVTEHLIGLLYFDQKSAKALCNLGR